MIPRAAFYPGSFDPITYGHLDIAERALRLFERLIVGVASSLNKSTLFSQQERVAQVERAVAEAFPKESSRLQVVGFESLLIDSMRQHEARVILRGMRAVSDFEFEFQLAGMNRALAPDIETVFLTASNNYHFLSSRFVREIALMGGDIGSFVPPSVASALIEKASERGLERKTLERKTLGAKS